MSTCVCAFTRGKKLCEMKFSIFGIKRKVGVRTGGDGK